MTSIQNTPTAETMYSSFPELEDSEMMKGAPTLLALLMAQAHLIGCSQQTVFPGNDLNFLHLATTPLIYGQYTNVVYPLRLQNPGDVPQLNPQGTPAENEIIRTQWAHTRRLFDMENNMDSALKRRFLEMVPREYKEDDAANRIRAPNASFLQLFERYVVNYGRSDESDREANLQRMKGPWDIQDGIMALINRTELGVRYAALCGVAHVINDQTARDIALLVIRRIPLLNDDYAAWTTEVNPTWPTFKSWWKRRFLLPKFTDAGRLGYGMAGTETPAGDNTADAAFEDSINNFAQAHAASQQAMANHSTLIAQLQQQAAECGFTTPAEC